MERNVFLVIDHGLDEDRMRIKTRGTLRRFARRVSPLAARSIHRIAVETETPKRSAYLRTEIPLSDAFKTRSRRSPLNAWPIQITSMTETVCQKPITVSSHRRSKNGWICLASLDTRLGIY